MRAASSASPASVGVCARVLVTELDDGPEMDGGPEPNPPAPDVVVMGQENGLGVPRADENADAVAASVPPLPEPVVDLGPPLPSAVVGVSGDVAAEDDAEAEDACARCAAAASVVPAAPPPEALVPAAAAASGPEAPGRALGAGRLLYAATRFAILLTRFLRDCRLAGRAQPRSLK